MDRPSPLARLLLLAYVVLVVYATLHPFSGWRNPGVSAFAYLFAAWPRYITGLDLAVNVLGYVPLGWLCVLALHPGFTGLTAAAAALAAGTALTVLLEATQSFLPTRIASNLDVLCNAAGTALGALLGAASTATLHAAGPLRRLRAAYIAPGALGDAGLILIALWFLTQLNPAGLVFGVGDMRDLFRHPAGAAHEPDVFVAIEALTAGGNLVAMGLLASAILNAENRVKRRVLLALFALAVILRSAAFAFLMQDGGLLGWLTPGAALGLAVGLPAQLLLAHLPRGARLACCAVLLMATTVLVNLAPANPYVAATLKVWEQGPFLNFNGLTRVVAAMWPFAALAYLIAVASRAAGGAGRNLE